MLLTISEFIGHLHPLLVHLPIGTLLIACILHWLSVKQRFRALQQAVSIILFFGMLAAIASSLSGYVLSGTDDYDEQMVSTHQWLGIATTVISIIFYFLHKHYASSKVSHAASVLLFLLIVFTGHLGGLLTHGSDYFSLNLSDKNIEIERKPIPDINEAVVYTDIVQPILQSKCYNCHGKNKQKGRLRLDDSVRIRKGGKDGIVLVAGKADESEMIKRLLLSRNHEDHMPPKEKPQLREEEIGVLHWWVSTGASFHKKVKEITPTEKVKSYLVSLQQTSIDRPIITDVPSTEVQKANEQVINSLKEKGIVVLPVAENSNYLMVSFITSDTVTNKDLENLSPLKQQLVWLKLNDTHIRDSALLFISSFKNITRLHLNHTKITDTGLVHLKGLNNLQYLNLVGTNVTLNGVLHLRELKNLKSLYLYQTDIKSSDWATIKNNFPDILVDSGGYKVPILESDTTEVKPK
jgi:uncharacterized membrane protein/mono/diheme cytochrome c family protein